ncbi:MAG TPA: sigma-70 family RNA polymerase sigma factor [Polyangiaceae bacterium]|nr:sigma-70 family RNA polymerase sigma factor [Polyangiaceae bacterium]
MSPPPPRAVEQARARAFVCAHTGFVSRVLWAAGVPRAAIDDAAQLVFLVALKQLGELRDERAFLYSVAVRTAKATKRHEAKSRLGSDPDAADTLSANQPGPDELVGQKRARELLDEIIDGMPEAIRTVFVLYELESMTMAEIATALGLAPGTVASRLRRGRELFQAGARRLQLREQAGAT